VRERENKNPFLSFKAVLIGQRVPCGVLSGTTSARRNNFSESKNKWPVSFLTWTFQWMYNLCNHPDSCEILTSGPVLILHLSQRRLKGRFPILVREAQAHFLFVECWLK
jgi:hypothetical protein